MKKTEKFSKRVFRPALLAEETAFLAAHAIPMIRAFRARRVSRAFAEKIMLAVTSVNNCRYCRWFHTDLALSNGVAKDTVVSIAHGIVGRDVPENEVPALLFAIHYAESERKIDPSRFAELEKHYGKEMAEDIYLIIRGIYFANLSGNTFDSFLSRMQGAPSTDGNAFFEAFFVSCSWLPLLLIAGLTKGGVNPLRLEVN